jgi:hypothetical protein
VQRSSGTPHASELVTFPLKNRNFCKFCWTSRPEKLQKTKNSKGKVTSPEAKWVGTAYLREVAYFKEAIQQFQISGKVRQCIFSILPKKYGRGGELCAIWKLPKDLFMMVWKCFF